MSVKKNKSVLPWVIYVRRFRGKNFDLYSETMKHTNIVHKTGAQLLNVKARDTCSYHQT